jgi:predicted phosphoribosyltransferase
VAAAEALQKIRPYADEIVCLDAPDFFYAVGQFYRSFAQVDDAEVVALLRAHRNAHADQPGERTSDR